MSPTKAQQTMSYAPPLLRLAGMYMLSFITLGSIASILNYSMLYEAYTI